MLILLIYCNNMPIQVFIIVITHYIGLFKVAIFLNKLSANKSIVYNLIINYNTLNKYLPLLESVNSLFTMPLFLNSYQIYPLKNIRKI